MSQNNLHEKLLLRIDEKLDRVDARLDTLTQVQTAQQKDLEYHIKRTNLLEERVDALRPSKLILWAGGLSAAIISIVELWRIFIL